MNQQQDGRNRVRQWGAGLLAAAVLSGGVFFAATPLVSARQVDDAPVPAADTEVMEMEADEYDEVSDSLAPVAELLGIGEDTLYAELDAGKSLAEIATANGVDPQQVIDLLIAEEEAWIDEMVAEGEVSAEEAAAWKTELAAEITFDVNTAYVDPFILAAQTIGIEVDALWSELDAGKTVAEVATANGVEPQAVIDAVVASENAYIDKAVAAGLVSDEEAQAWRAEVDETVREAVNETLDFDENEELAYFEEFEDAMSPLVAELLGLDEDALFDLMLPGLDGMAICAALRAESDVPIIMLTAKGAQSDRLDGLESGADDYIVKPFAPEEVVARVKAVLRRTRNTAQQTLTCGDFTLDEAARTVSVNGEALTLSQAQFALMRAFLRHPNQVLTREQLIMLAFDDEYDAFDRSIDAHIRRLRRQVHTADRQPIQTVYGAGYKFVVGGA